jgi:hypothetical protein
MEEGAQIAPAQVGEECGARGFFHGAIRGLRTAFEEDSNGITKFSKLTEFFWERTGEVR